MRCVLLTFIIISLFATYVPDRLEAYSKNKNTVGQKILKTPVIGKPIYWTGLGMYKVAEFFVVEMLRPFKAIRDKMIDIWGVTSKE